MAAPSVYLHHPGNAGELAFYYPVLDGAQFGVGIGVLIARSHVENVLVYLAQPRGYRTHLRRAETFGNVFGGRFYLFGYELAR